MLIKEIGAFAGLAAFLGLAVLALLSFTQGRDIRRLREWAGSAPERDAERKEATSTVAAQRAEELRKLEEARDRRARGGRPARGAPPAARGGPAGTDPRRADPRAASPASAAGSPSRATWSALFVVVVLIAGGVAYAVTQRLGDEATARAASTASSRGVLKPSEIEVTVLNGTAVAGPGRDLRRQGRAQGLQARRGHQQHAPASPNSVVMFERGHAPRGAQGRQGAGDLAGAADDRGNRIGLGRGAGRGRGRRGQCLVGRASLAGASSSRCSSSPRSPPSPGRSG